MNVKLREKKPFDMKLFDMKAKTIKWWERLLLPFGKTYITADVSKDKTVFCMSKRLFGKLYLIKMWEEETKVKGKKFDYMNYLDKDNIVKCTKPLPHQPGKIEKLEYLHFEYSPTDFHIAKKLNELIDVVEGMRK